MKVFEVFVGRFEESFDFLDPVLPMVQRESTIQIRVNLQAHFTSPGFVICKSTNYIPLKLTPYYPMVSNRSTLYFYKILEPCTDQFVVVLPRGEKILGRIAQNRQLENV